MVTFQRRDTLVIYQDGTCESLQTCIDSRKFDKNVPGQEKPIVNVDTQKITKVAYFNSALSETMMLTYFVVSPDRPNDEPIEFVYFNLDADNLAPRGRINRFKIQRASQDAKLVGYTVVDGDLYPSLITICK